MNLRLQVKYSADGYPWLCFKHAVALATYNGKDITTEIDDYSSEYYGGPTTCSLCEEEAQGLRDKTLENSNRLLRATGAKK